MLYVTRVAVKLAVEQDSILVLASLTFDEKLTVCAVGHTIITNRDRAKCLTDADSESNGGRAIARANTQTAKKCSCLVLPILVKKFQYCLFLSISIVLRLLFTKIYI
jgi:hypothetical protein